MQSSTLIVANGEPPSSQLLLKLAQEHDQLVAVDGGLHSYLQAGLTPHLILGDFDSISEKTRAEQANVTQIETPDQYLSDLEKAISYLFNTGGDQITVCGALGKRIDHTLANIFLLCRYPNQLKFQSDYEICFALPKTITIPCQKGQIFSLIPVSTHVTSVTTQGLQWELHHQELTQQFISISNVCLSDKVTISFEQGDLVACLLKEEMVDKTPI